jgi:hypothetical protein
MADFIFQSRAPPPSKLRAASRGRYIFFSFIEAPPFVSSGYTGSIISDYFRFGSGKACVNPGIFVENSV